jgi:hypothetical protein
LETTSRDGHPAIRKSGRIAWPRKTLGPPPGLREINLLCWSLFVLFLVAPASVLLYLRLHTGSGSLRALHSDFVYFYGIGQIANNYPAPRIYDAALQHQTFNQIYTPAGGAYGPSPYPPFVALFFRPFAYLSFDAAFLLWAAVSLTLYIAGIITIARTITSPPSRLATSLTLCLALAFEPFFFGTLLNGQLAAVALFAVSLTVYLDRQARPFAAGMALAILAYKPTLLIVLLPMLVLTRRGKTILGFCTGLAALLLVTTLFAGPGIWPAYLRFLEYFSHTAGIAGRSALQLWQFVDLNSFAHLLFGRQSILLVAIMIAFALWTAALVGKAHGNSEPVKAMTWTVALTWTLLLNVYVPIYDSVLVVVALAATLAALRDPVWTAARNRTILFAVLLLAASWITEAIARQHSMQILTLVLAAFGIHQLLILQRMVARKPVGST